jgi:hypothetical protein
MHIQIINTKSTVHAEEVDIMLTCQLLELGFSFEDIVLLRTVAWGLDN